MNDSTLIAVGDSFVYGHLGDDLNYKTCWDRSWVSKLGKIANFKENINLAAPGGSNHRSFRVLTNYLIENYSPDKKYVIFYGISDISRFEISMDRKISKSIHVDNLVKNPLEKQYDDQDIVGIGPWTSLNSKIFDSYLKTHYTFLSTDRYNKELLNSQILSVHLMLSCLNIKHYFIETICPVDTINRKIMEKNIPVIDFIHDNKRMMFPEFLLSKGFKSAPCDHFDHDGNNFMANYLYNYIVGEQNGK